MTTRQKMTLLLLSSIPDITLYGGMAAWVLHQDAAYKGAPAPRCDSCLNALSGALVRQRGALGSPRTKSPTHPLYSFEPQINRPARRRGSRAPRRSALLGEDRGEVAALADGFRLGDVRAVFREVVDELLDELVAEGDVLLLAAAEPAGEDASRGENDEKKEATRRPRWMASLTRLPFLMNLVAARRRTW